MSTVKKCKTATFSRIFRGKNFDIFSPKTFEFLTEKWKFQTVWSCYHVNKITSVASKNSNFGAQFAVALLCFVYRKSGQRDSKLTNVRILKNLKNTKPRHIQKMEVGVDDDSGINFCLFVYFSLSVIEFIFFSWNQSCQQLKIGNFQHFHEFFIPNFFDHFSREIKVVNS